MKTLKDKSLSNIYIKTFGCRTNTADSSELQRKIVSSGSFSLTPLKNADICLVNTCCITAKAERKLRQFLSKTKSDYPKIKIITFGCYSKALPQIEYYLDHTKDVFDYISNKYCNKSSKSSVNNVTTKSNKVRQFIKIQEGCSNYCTYCIVPYVRKRQFNINPDDLIRQLTQLHSNGFNEVIFTGTNIGKYKHQKHNLFKLIREVLNRTKIPRIRLGSINPDDLSDDIINLFNDSRLLPHLHLSIQHGDNEVLKIMNRNYSIEDVTKIVRKLRQINPLFNITTDIIVGFPGETNDQFDTSLLNLDKLELSKIHYFPYSKRPGTAAAKYKNQITDSVKYYRIDQISEFNSKLQSEFAQKNRENDQIVLFEQKKGENWTGFTENYLKINHRSQKNLNNCIYKIRPKTYKIVQK